MREIKRTIYNIIQSDEYFFNRLHMARSTYIIHLNYVFINTPSVYTYMSGAPIRFCIVK